MLDKALIERIRAEVDIRAVVEDSLGVPLRREGGRWVACCPFHVEKSPSFGVDVERRIFKCFGCGAGGDVFKFLQLHRGLSFMDSVKDGAARAGIVLPDAPKPRAAKAGRDGEKLVFVCAYDYRDAAGALVHQTVRYNVAGEDGQLIRTDSGGLRKTFLQRRPAAQGMTHGRKAAKRDRDGAWWLWTLEGIEPLLFHLPEIAERSSEPVWVTEGEKDANALMAAGKLATTCPMGAGKWRESYTAALAGREVVICGDYDTAGMGHILTVGKHLTEAGCRVQIVDWEQVIPANGEKWDAAKFLTENM